MAKGIIKRIQEQQKVGNQKPKKLIETRNGGKIKVKFKPTFYSQILLSFILLF